MEAITINSVIQYITDDGEVFYERVLWLDASLDDVVVFDLGDKGSFPAWKKLSDLQYLIDSKQCRIVEYQSKRLAVQEKDLTITEKEDLEKAWAIIKDLVTNEPDIYSAKARSTMIKNAVTEHSIYKNYVYRKLRAYWKYGKVKNALLIANFNKGAKGKVRNSSDVKRGRPFKDRTCNNIGMNITEDIKKIFMKAYKRFYDKEKLPLESSYYKMLGKYFNVEIVTDFQGHKIIEASEYDKLPSFGAFKYWHPKLTNIKKTLIARHGNRDFELNHKGVMGESQSEAYNPGAMFQIDATIADIYLLSRDNRNWIIGRPVVYIIIDVFSRYIVGFYVGLEGPSWLGAMMALYNTTRNKVELCRDYGIEINKNEWNCSNLPNALICDRGEMESTKPHNLINNLGIDVKILPPYKANWKGIVEQSFRRLNTKALHWLPGTVPREFRVRGERDHRKDALLNLEEFTQILIRSILYFNNNYMDYYKRDEDLLAEDVPSIPSVLWEWGIKNRGGLLKSFPEDIIKLNLMPTEDASITYKGLQYKGMSYSCPQDIETGEYERARVLGSRPVIISYDPRDLRCVYVNEGLSYKKYYLLDNTQKSHLFEEELDFLIERENFNERDNTPMKIANTVHLNAKIDAIVKKAKQEEKREGATGNKSTKDIRDNRQAEKESTRKVERWELDQTEEMSGVRVIPFDRSEDDKYVPAPNYIDDIDEDE